VGYDYRINDRDLLLNVMEENKNCCENKEKGCCGGAMSYCCPMKKCHVMKKLIFIIIIIVAFCLGTQLGELKSEARRGGEFRGGMMNWNYKNVKCLTGDETPKTPTPPVVNQ